MKTFATKQLKPLASQRGLEAGEAGDVPTRAVEPRDDAAGDGLGHVPKDDRDRPRLPLDGNGRRGRACHDDVGLQTDQLLRERSCPINVIAVPTKVHPHVAAIGPTRVRKGLSERRVATFHTGSFSSNGMSTPMRRIRSPCCARAPSGNAASSSRGSAVRLRGRSRRARSSARAFAALELIEQAQAWRGGVALTGS
jgi:hypothetical protein